MTFTGRDCILMLVSAVMALFASLAGDMPGFFVFTTITLFDVGLALKGLR